VRRPPAFYAHLMELERKAAGELGPEARALLGGEEAPIHSTAAVPATIERASAAELSQLALVPGDREHDLTLFPEHAYDADHQQVDLRRTNSWRLRLADVSTAELLEVQLVNAIAPFVLCARLKPLMERVPTRDKHVVNVSAVEGQFSRGTKTDKHPHTNMAKAALNMLTRTSAPDCLRSGIHMNSVDTGWITDEDPAEHALRKERDGFQPPLDVVDGAARVCDPIVSGFLTGNHVWGQFLKDYAPAAW
jgi:NAD(P)-dependent dehydrogenase (short-subunit alcohol dehydrogenase family)